MTTPATPDPKETPRCDAATLEAITRAAGGRIGPLMDFARQLERELAAAQQTNVELRRDKVVLFRELKQLAIIGVFCGKCGTKYSRCELCGASSHQDHMLSPLHEEDCILMQPLPAAPALEGGQP